MRVGCGGHSAASLRWGARGGRRRRFTNTQVGELFREQASGGLARRAMLLLPDEYCAWEHLLETLRSGRTYSLHSSTP
jgi:hypothetical protein